MTTALAEYVDLRQELLGILWQHHGRQRAIPAGDFARLLRHRDDRRIRQIIGDLIREGYPIASLISEPKGYFMVQSMAEAQSYQERLKGG